LAAQTAVAIKQHPHIARRARAAAPVAPSRAPGRELLAEAARERRFPKARATLSKLVARWVVVLAAVSPLLALWILTKPGP
jgi:hypothetical protein